MDTVAEMEKIVNATVEAYQDDFYQFDIATIERMGEGEEAIWEVRPTGTYLFPSGRANHETCDFYRSVNETFHRNRGHHWYLIMKGRSLERISDKTALWYIDSFERSFVKSAKRKYHLALRAWMTCGGKCPTLKEFQLRDSD